MSIFDKKNNIDSIFYEIVPYFGKESGKTELVAEKMWENLQTGCELYNNASELPVFTNMLMADIVKTAGAEKLETSLAALKIKTRETILKKGDIHRYMMENTGRDFMPVFLQILMYAVNRCFEKFETIARRMIEFTKSRPGIEKESLVKLLWVMNSVESGKYLDCVESFQNAGIESAADIGWLLDITSSALSENKNRTLMACLETSGFGDIVNYIGNSDLKDLSKIRAVNDETFKESVRGILAFSRSVIIRIGMQEAEKYDVVRAVCALPDIDKNPGKINCLNSIVGYITDFNSFSEIAWFIDSFRGKSRDIYNTFVSSLLRSSVKSVEELNRVCVEKSVHLLPVISPLIIKKAAEFEIEQWNEFSGKIISIGGQALILSEDEFELIVESIETEPPASPFFKILRSDRTLALELLEDFAKLLKNTGISSKSDAACQIKRAFGSPSVYFVLSEAFPEYIECGVLGSNLEYTSDAVDFYLLQPPDAEMLLKSSYSLKRYIDAPDLEKAAFGDILKKNYTAAIYGSPCEDPRDMVLFEEYESVIARRLKIDDKTILRLKGLYDNEKKEAIDAPEHQVDFVEYLKKLKLEKLFAYPAETSALLRSLCSLLKGKPVEFQEIEYILNYVPASEEPYINKRSRKNYLQPDHEAAAVQNFKTLFNNFYKALTEGRNFDGDMVTIAALGISVVNNPDKFFAVVEKMIHFSMQDLFTQYCARNLSASAVSAIRNFDGSEKIDLEILKSLSEFLGGYLKTYLFNKFNRLFPDENSLALFIGAYMNADVEVKTIIGSKIPFEDKKLKVEDVIYNRVRDRSGINMIIDNLSKARSVVGDEALKLHFSVSRQFLDTLFMQDDIDELSANYNKILKSDFFCVRLIDPATEAIEGVIKGYRARSGKQKCLVISGVKISAGLISRDEFEQLWDKIKSWANKMARFSGCDYVVKPSHEEKFSNHIKVNYIVNAEMKRSPEVRLDTPVMNAEGKMTVMCNMIM